MVHPIENGISSFSTHVILVLMKSSNRTVNFWNTRLTSFFTEMEVKSKLRQLRRKRCRMYTNRRINMLTYNSPCYFPFSCPAVHEFHGFKGWWTLPKRCHVHGRSGQTCCLLLHILTKTWPLSFKGYKQLWTQFVAICYLFECILAWPVDKRMQLKYLKICQSLRLWVQLTK